MISNGGGGYFECRPRRCSFVESDDDIWSKPWQDKKLTHMTCLSLFQDCWRHSMETGFYSEGSISCLHIFLWQTRPWQIAGNGKICSKWGPKNVSWDEIKLVQDKKLAGSCRKSGWHRGIEQPATSQSWQPVSLDGNSPFWTCSIRMWRSIDDSSNDLDREDDENSGPW